MKTRIILIRHGETGANRQKKYIGRKNSKLTSYGIYQARCVKEAMAKHSIDDIFVSSSKRALEFSNIIFGKREKKVLDVLREMDFGVLEGLSYSSALKKYPRAYNLWLKDPERFNIPKGEPLADFKERVLKAFEKIVSDNYGRSVAVITHGGPIMLIVGKILKSKKLWKIMPHLASITIVEFKKNKPQILKLNDISHYG